MARISQVSPPVEVKVSDVKSVSPSKIVTQFAPPLLVVTAGSLFIFAVPFWF